MTPFQSLREYEQFIYTLPRKHIPPDIKHHRVPAPDLSFTRLNLPALITEIEALASSP